MDENPARALIKEAGISLQCWTNRQARIVAQDLSLSMPWNFSLYDYVRSTSESFTTQQGASSARGRTRPQTGGTKQELEDVRPDPFCLRRMPPGGRLGRPKGSKNKRTLMQQILNLNKEQPSETQRDTNRSTADVMQWIGSGQHQRQQRQQQLPPPEPDLISFEFDMEHAFDTTIAFGEGESPAGDGSRDLMLDMGQDLSADDDSGLSHQACLAQVLAANSPNSHSVLATDPFAFLSPFLAQTSRALVSGQQLPVSDSGPGQFRAFPSDGSTDPFGTIFPSSNPAPSGYSRASPPISPVSPPSAASNLPSNVRSGCLCLQRLVRLLYHLEELRFPQGHGHGHAARAHQAAGPSADSVLRGVQAAKMPWQGFIHCSVHGDDDGHREALLLFAMSIRILLLAVQKLNSTIRLSQTELSSDIAVSVGDFELMGEAKAEIIGVVIRRALWAITIALQHLWERAGQPTAQTGSELGSSSPPERSSPISILTGSSCKDPPQVRPRAFSAPASTTSFGAEDESVVSLLATLQCTMKTLEQETQASGAGSEPKPSPI
ncbi:uncharacterized protein CDV56_101221 [Aspergillus thermomutatus]|uniref:Aflatoxin regulatory protein domain-containing protein n=1 Tax=Aspergillus thermomutatus TaxID=41047 RepID=A0A397GQJ0_ASPTH|nr:uncharacterized protein CDV56_101221 [Aspergillus thermomutatus]RHZ51784.1 hypothetical protein CDV56_101221 [Aspergillus thermomutatus]